MGRQVGKWLLGLLSTLGVVAAGILILQNRMSSQSSHWVSVQGSEPTLKLLLDDFSTSQTESLTAWLQSLKRRFPAYFKKFVLMYQSGTLQKGTIG